MRKFAQKSLVALIIVVAIGFAGQGQQQMAAQSGNYDITITLRGLIAFVDLPQQKRMYALLPKASARSAFQCDTSVPANEHLAMVRVKDLYTTPGTGSDDFHLLTIRESEVRIDPCTKRTFMATGVPPPSMKELTGGNANVCANCADSASFNPVLLAGRFLIDQGPIDFSDAVKTSSGKPWKVGTTPHASLPESATTSYTACTGTQTKLMLARWNGSTFVDQETMILYPKNHKIEIEILNIPQDLLLSKLPVSHTPSKTVDHFAWFYGLSPVPTGTGPCVVPEDPGFVAVAGRDLVTGKPYCPFVTFTH